MQINKIIMAELSVLLFASLPFIYFVFFLSSGYE